jgi:hypothetical protein
MPHKCDAQEIGELNQIIASAEAICRARGVHAERAGFYDDETWSICAARDPDGWRLGIAYRGRPVLLAAWPASGGPGHVSLNAPGPWRAELIAAGAAAYH